MDRNSVVEPRDTTAHLPTKCLPLITKLLLVALAGAPVAFVDTKIRRLGLARKALAVACDPGAPRGSGRCSGHRPRACAGHRHDSRTAGEDDHRGRRSRRPQDAHRSPGGVLMQHHELTNEQIIHAGRAAGSWPKVRHQAIYLLLARGLNRTEIARSLQVSIREVTTRANMAPVFGWNPASVYGAPVVEHFIKSWGERDLAKSVTREVDRLSMPFHPRQSITDLGEPGPESSPGDSALYWSERRREDENWELRMMELDHADAPQVVRGRCGPEGAAR
jgi:hypothetical protein